MTRIITLQMLRDANACRAQIVLFRRTFGESTPVTRELCEKHASDFDFGFAARHFLSEDGYTEYEKVQAPAWKEYMKVQGLAHSEYLKVQASAWKEYLKVQGQAWEEYEKVQARALAEYRKVRSLIFCKLFNEQE